MIFRFDQITVDFPTPEAPNANAASVVQELLGGIMYHQSKGYAQLAKIWNGLHPEDGQPLVVTDEMPQGYPWPEFDEEPQLSSPGDIDPEMIKYYADQLS